jgi:hypothetical protein
MILRSVPAIVAAIVFAAACRPNQTVERQTKDAAIKAQVKAKLASHVGATTVTAVEVNVTNGVVTLAGPVHSAEERQKSEEVARSVEGVTGVNNNLQISSEPGAQQAFTPTSSGAGPIFVPFPTPTPAP